jgi:hypothetical protein
MTIISEEGYLQRQTTGTPCKQNVKGKVKAKIFRDWWLVKASNRNKGYVSFETVVLPESYIGKKVRFRVEILESEPIDIRKQLQGLKAEREQAQKNNDIYRKSSEEVQNDWFDALDKWFPEEQNGNVLNSNR